MIPLRPLLRDHRLLTGWLFAVSLMLKLIVPAGFMPIAADGGVRLEICTGMGVAPVSAAPMAAMPGMAHHGDPAHPPGKAEQPCGFGGLLAFGAAGAPVIAATPGPVAPDWRPGASKPSAALPSSHLRPPPQGPPAIL